MRRSGGGGTLLCELGASTERKGGLLASSLYRHRYDPCAHHDDVERREGQPLLQAGRQHGEKAGDACQFPCREIDTHLVHVS